MLNANKATGVLVSNCNFKFQNFTVHHDKLVTTLFRGAMMFKNNEVKIYNHIEDKDNLSQFNIFSSDVEVSNSIISNDCSKCHLGDPCLLSSVINFDNSQLFNGSLPRRMENNRIKFGKNTPKLAANPFSHKGMCIWKNNIIESEKSVDFNLTYKGIDIESTNNKLTNINAIGMLIE